MKLKTIKNLTIAFIIIILNYIYHSPVYSANKTSFKIYTPPPKNIFVKEIDQVLPEPQASLLDGMLFGVKATMPKDFFSALKRTGVLHIIALSGTNISILVATVYTTLLVICNRKTAILFSILTIALFINFVGVSPSVLRAGIMAILSLIAQYFGRQYWGLLSLVITGILMCSVKPNLIVDLGFQLSFMATLGMMLLADSSKKPNPRDLRSKIPGIRLGIGSMITKNLRITLAAQIFTLPIILANFGELSFVSPLTNLLVAPVVPFITNWGMAAAILLVLLKPVGILLSWVLWLFLSYFILVIKLTGQIPLASINLPKINWITGAVYYLIVFYLILRKKVKIKF